MKIETIILVEVFDVTTNDKIGEFKHNTLSNHWSDVNTKVEHIAERNNITEYYFKTTDITDAEKSKIKAITQEKNILIAEFMGAKFSNYADGTKGVIFDSNINPEGYLPIMGIEGLKYHKSWDWLMPVVEKIESIEDSNLPYISFSKNNFCVSIRNGFCEIISGDFLMDFDEFDRHSGTKKEATYNAVVEFIEWYNENK